MEVTRVFLLTILCSCFCLLCQAQYKYEDRCYTDDLQIAADDVPYNKTYFKHYPGGFRFYRRYEPEQGKKMIVTDIDFPTFRIKRKDTLDLSADDLSSITDCLATKTYDVLVGYRRLAVYNRKTKAINITRFEKPLSFRNILPLNDSTGIMYEYINHHPLDGFSGLEMYMINLNSSQIFRSFKTRTNGIALSHMTVNWTVNAGNYIYTVYPLSGELIKYDQQFKVIDRRLLPISWTNYTANLAYQNETDSLIYKEYDRIRSIVDRLGTDSIKKNRSLILSDLHTKGFVSDVSKTVRANYEFVEKLLPFNDSIIIFTLSRPGYDLKQRDVFFYNINTFRIVRSIPQWQCAKKDSLSKFEDFFSVNVINDVCAGPIFIEDKVYYNTMYNIDLYKDGNIDTLRKSMMKDINKHNYTCRLLEYAY